MERLPKLELSVSATTRAPRPGEQDGVAYHFLTARSSTGGWRRGVRRARDYAGHSYGTLRAELEGRTRGGAPVVLEIELQGARQMRAAMPEAVRSSSRRRRSRRCAERLIARGTDDPEGVERRLRDRARGARGAAASSRTWSSTTGSRTRWSSSTAIAPIELNWATRTTLEDQQERQ